MSGPRVTIVGAPGSGKSTVGRILAHLLDLPLRDTDADIVALAGKPISEIFLDEGEDHFREVEHTAVTAALAEHSGVLALGGGSILDPRTRAALADHYVIWLTVSLTDAVNRVGLGTTRPVLAFNPRATMRHLMELREPMYAEVANHKVDTTGRPPREIAAEIVSALPSEQTP